MESWFLRLGSCCSRSKPVGQDSHLPGIRLEDLHSLSTLPHVHSPSELPSETETPLLVPPHESKSARSTITSLSSSVVGTASLLLSTTYSGQMKCSGCEEQATGFCVGCPSRRYCYHCYEVVHRSKSGGAHRFCSYSARQVIWRSRKHT